MASKKEKQYQKDLKNLINQQYQAGQQFLGGQEARLQQFQPQVEEQITTTYESQVPQVQQLAERQTGQVRSQQEQTRAERESALASARRQYQEGTQRTQALFGGVGGSSAGMAQSELLAREQSRQMGATQRQAQQTIGGLEQNIRDIETTTANQLQKLEVDKSNALLQARDTFRQQLDAINSQRFQLAQDKANKQIQALQDFNARRRQIEDFTRQQQANLQAYKDQQTFGLGIYEQQLKLAQRYPTTTGSNINYPNLIGYGTDNTGRLGAINQLMALSDTDLRKGGYAKETVTIGNTQQNVIRDATGALFNTFTGERYALFAMIRGDASDGLPGIRGIGENHFNKKLVRTFNTSKHLFLLRLFSLSQ